MPVQDGSRVTAPAAVAAVTSAAAGEVAVRLFNYRVRVRVKVVDLQDEVVVDYFVQAPSQCSATKHAMLRAEVTDILLSELWLQPLPEGQSFVFSTTEECP